MSCDVLLAWAWPGRAGSTRRPHLNPLLCRSMQPCQRKIRTSKRAEIIAVLLVCPRDFLRAVALWLRIHRIHHCSSQPQVFFEHFSCTCVNPRAHALHLCFYDICALSEAFQALVQAGAACAPLRELDMDVTVQLRGAATSTTEGPIQQKRARQDSCDEAVLRRLSQVRGHHLRWQSHAQPAASHHCSYCVTGSLSHSTAGRQCYRGLGWLRQLRLPAVWRRPLPWRAFLQPGGVAAHLHLAGPTAVGRSCFANSRCSGGSSGGSGWQ